MDFVGSQEHAREHFVLIFPGQRTELTPSAVGTLNAHNLTRSSTLIVRWIDDDLPQVRI